MSSGHGKIAVLLGGNSAEREVSLMSGRAVLDSLNRQGFNAFPLDPNNTRLESLSESGLEKAFIMLHGRGGEDGVVQGVLTHAKIPFTGSGVLGCALAMDKWRTKLIWDALSLPTPPCLVINDLSNFQQVADNLGLPMIVKPCSEGSTIGLSKVETSGEIPKAYKLAKKYDSVVIAEKWIDGVELTASILDNKSLPLIQIEAPLGNYDYEAKYFSDETKYLRPTSLDSSEEKKLQALCLKAFKGLGCSGWGRVDLMLDKQGRPWLLEANTVPGMTAHSLVPMAAEAVQISFDQLVLHILESANVE